MVIFIVSHLEVDPVHDELNSVKADLARMQSENKKLSLDRDAHAQSIGENERLKESLADVTNLCERQKGVIAGLEHSVERFKRAIQDSEGIVLCVCLFHLFLLPNESLIFDCVLDRDTDVQNRISSLRETILVMEKAEAKLKDDLCELNDKHTRLTDKVAELVTENGQLMDEVQGFKAGEEVTTTSDTRMVDLANRVAELEGENVALTDQLAEYTDGGFNWHKDVIDMTKEPVTPTHDSTKAGNAAVFAGASVKKLVDFGGECVSAAEAKFLSMVFPKAGARPFVKYGSAEAGTYVHAIVVPTARTAEMLQEGEHWILFNARDDLPMIYQTKVRRWIDINIKNDEMRHAAVCKW